MVTGAIELERAAKRIGSSLQAAPSVWVSGEHMAALDGLNLADIAIVSAVELAVGGPPDGAFTLPDVEGVGVIVGTAQGDKCDRCWKVLPEVRPHRDDHKLCRRCAGAVDSQVGAG